MEFSKPILIYYNRQNKQLAVEYIDAILKTKNSSLSVMSMSKTEKTCNNLRNKGIGVEEMVRNLVEVDEERIKRIKKALKMNN